MTEVEQRPYLTLHEAAQRLQVTVDDCYRMVRTGDLPYVRVGRSIRIPFYAVEGLLSIARGGIATAQGDQATDELLPGAHPVVDVPPQAPDLPPLDEGPEASDGGTGGSAEAPVQAAPARQPAIKPAAPQKAMAPTAAAAANARQPRAAKAPGRLVPAVKRAYHRFAGVRVNIPRRSRGSAAIVVSDSNVRAIVVRRGVVRSWGTVGLNEGVVRDGEINDAQAFMTALAELEAKLAGTRLVGRPFGVVVSGRNLVIGRFHADLPDAATDRSTIQRLVCERLSVRLEDVSVDYHLIPQESPEKPSKGTRRAQKQKGPKETREAKGPVSIGPNAAKPASQPEVAGMAVLQSVLESVLRPVAAAGSRVTIAQPKAIALVAAAGIKTGIIVDLEPTSIVVIIVRGGLAEVVRDVTISTELRPQQVAQILAGQVNRSVGYYNARYRTDHLPQNTPILVTGEGAVDPVAVDLALATLPYPRQAIVNPFGAPENFQPGQYAAALGVTQQELARRARGHAADRWHPVFDFLPEAFKPKPLPFRQIVAGSMAAVMLMGGVPAYQAFADVSGEVESLQSAVERLEPQVRLRTLQLRKVAVLQEQLKTTNQAIEKLVASELAVHGTDRGFAGSLGALRAAVPEGVKLGEVDDDGSLMQVAASAADPDDLFAFVRALSTLEGFSDVRIKSIALSPSGVTASIKVSRDPLMPVGGAQAAAATQP